MRAARSFWKNYIVTDRNSDCEVQKFIVSDENDGVFMEGILLYKKNEYLRLIPYLGKYEPFVKRLEAVVKVPGNL